MRVEKKFLIHKNSIDTLNLFLIKHSFYSIYPDRKVSSIYLDDFDMTSAKDNIIGLSNRKKFRLRYYNNSINDLLFEIKIKCNKLGSKKTFELNKSFSKYNYENTYPNLKKFLLKKYNEVLEYQLLPIIKTEYDRSYYQNDLGITLTLDQNIRYFFVKDNIFADYHFSTFDEFDIMELKYPESIINNVNMILRDSNFTSSRNSKYLKGLSLLNLIDFY